MAKFMVNGVICDQLALSDRAIHYGDGLFETIAIRNGRLEFWQRHMARLASGCQRLGIAMPDDALLLTEARRLIDRDEGVLKIIITRGEGGRGYRPPDIDSSRPSRILGLYPLPDYPVLNVSQGVELRYCSTPVSTNPALAGMKHLNRLEQVLARSEWSDPAITEGLMCDINGYVIEGTMSNLLFVRDGVLNTPDLSKSGVAGIIREVILEQAESLNIPVHCQHYLRRDLESADEIFVCNSVIGLWPVRRIEHHSYDAGPLMQQLLDALNGKRQQKGEYEII